LWKLLAEFTVTDHLDPDALISNYLDSVSTLELLSTCESEFNILLVDDLLAGDPLTFNELAQEIASRTA
jgi:acyl carrier protein